MTQHIHALIIIPRRFRHEHRACFRLQVVERDSLCCVGGRPTDGFLAARNCSVCREHRSYNARETRPWRIRQTPHYTAGKLRRRRATRNRLQGAQRSGEGRSIMNPTRVLPTAFAFLLTTPALTASQTTDVGSDNSARDG